MHLEKGLSSNKILTNHDGRAKFSKFCESSRRFSQAVFTVFSKCVLTVSKMVVACVAVNCSNNCINSPELSFHRLPKVDFKCEARRSFIFIPSVNNGKNKKKKIFLANILRVHKNC